VSIKGESRTELYRRLARRNLASLLRYKFIYEYGYDKGEVVAGAIVADICETIRCYYARPGDLEPGQVRYPAPAATERAGHGKTMARTRLVPVVLTLVAEEDVEAMVAPVTRTQRREIRVRRLTHEAHQQGALLSQADLGLLLGCSPGMIGDIAVRLRHQGEFLPLRGYLADMGVFPTHKAAIIRLYLQGLTTPDIAVRTHHTKVAVDRYLRGFDRVRLLAPKFAREELPLLTGMSMGLVDQYLALLEEHGLLAGARKEVRRRA
jgi:hypothetical protein